MSGFDEPYWNALQLLGWVYLRAPDVVSCCSDDGGEVRWHFQEADILGEEGNIERVSFEAPSPKPSRLTIELYAATRDSTARPFAKMEKAEEDIHRKLQEGAITATGRPAGTGARQNILGLDWIDLRIDFDLCSPVDRSDHQPAYSDVKVERGPVLNVWPEVASNDADEKPADVGANSDGGSVPARQHDKQGHTAKGGRKQGSGQFNDSEALESMLRHLAAGRAPAVFSAAGLVADQVSGASEDSKQRRLARKFKDKFGLAPPAGKTWAQVVDEL